MINNSLTIVGLMSGTSMDGIDCCIAKIEIDKDLNLKYKIIANQSFNFNSKIRKKIKKFIGQTHSSKIKEINDYVGQVYLELTKEFLLLYDFDAIAIHGQTIHHIDKLRSIQVCDPSYLASFFKVPIVYNFRQNDIEDGGNGAPLMPFLDSLLFKKSKSSILTINLGGIANVCYVPKDMKRHNVLGFDTGPGMSLIDEYVFKVWRDNCDYNGKYSSNGKINDPLLDYLIDKSAFIFKIPPKSTSRENFGLSFLEQVIDSNDMLDPADILRTLVKFTSISIKLNVDNFIKNKFEIGNLLISGGGANHPLLMDDIKKDLDIPSLNIIDYGIESKFKESFLMAVLGYAKIKSIKSNIPSVTGAKRNIVLGRLYYD